MTRLAAWTAGVGVAALVVFATADARAQSVQRNDAAAAEALFKDGKRLMGAGQFEAACPKFAESLRLDPGIGTMLWLGDCESKNGQIASAWAVFHEAEALAARQKDPRISVARDEAQKLEPRMSKIVLDTTDIADDDVEVKRDGVVLGKPLWGTPIPIDGGEHTISASALNKKTWQTTVAVPVERGSVTVKIPRLDDEVAPPPPMPLAAPPPPKPPADPTRGRTQRIAGIATAAAGALGLVAGSWLGLRVKSKNDDSKAHCDGQNRCDETGFGLRNDALDLATGSNIAFIAGGAVLAGGIALYLTAPRPSTVAVTAVPLQSGAGASVTGRF